MRTFSQMDTWLGVKASRPTGQRGTRIERRGVDAIAVKYHNTDVVTLHRDGRVVFNSDGWHTLTTRARMNEYQEAGMMFTAKGIMYFGINWNLSLIHISEPT